MIAHKGVDGGAGTKDWLGGVVGGKQIMEFQQMCVHERKVVNERYIAQHDG